MRLWDLLQGFDWWKPFFSFCGGMNIHHLPVILMWTCMYIYILYIHTICVYDLPPSPHYFHMCFSGTGKQIKSSQDNMPSTELKPGRFCMSCCHLISVSTVFFAAFVGDCCFTLNISRILEYLKVTSKGLDVRWFISSKWYGIYRYWFIYPLLFNVAMENCRFTDDLWWFTYKKWWFSIATLNNQRVFFLPWTGPNRCSTWSLKHLVHQQSWNLKHGKTYWGFQG